LSGIDKLIGVPELEINTLHGIPLLIQFILYKTASAIRQGLEYIMCVVCLICNDEPLLKSGIRTQKKAKDLQMPETYSVICHSIIFNKQK